MYRTHPCVASARRKAHRDWRVTLTSIWVTAYYSKTLNKAEKNDCFNRRELLAIMRTLQHFHQYLYVKEFHLRTDHSAVTWLMNFNNSEG
jgi:hypothetical protein